MKLPELVTEYKTNSYIYRPRLSFSELGDHQSNTGKRKTRDCSYNTKTGLKGQLFLRVTRSNQFWMDSNLAAAGSQARGRPSRCRWRCGWRGRRRRRGQTSGPCRSRRRRSSGRSLQVLAGCINKT